MFQNHRLDRSYGTINYKKKYKSFGTFVYRYMEKYTHLSFRLEPIFLPATRENVEKNREP